MINSDNTCPQIVLAEKQAPDVFSAYPLVENAHTLGYCSAAQKQKLEGNLIFRTGALSPCFDWLERRGEGWRKLNCFKVFDGDFTFEKPVIPRHLSRRIGKTNSKK